MLCGHGDCFKTGYNCTQKKKKQLIFFHNKNIYHNVYVLRKLFRIGPITSIVPHCSQFVCLFLKKEINCDGLLLKTQCKKLFY